MYVTISISLCLVIMLIYNTLIITKYKKVPKSLSETAYLISNGGNVRRYLFTLYCVCTGITLLPPLLMNTPDGFEVLSFLICSGFLFSGFSPNYKDRSSLDRSVHYWAAYISFAAFLILGFTCLGWKWVLAYGIVFGGFCLWKPKCYTYFCEILALITLCMWILL